LIYEDVYNLNQLDSILLDKLKEKVQILMKFCETFIEKLNINKEKIYEVYYRKNRNLSKVKEYIKENLKEFQVITWSNNDRIIFYSFFQKYYKNFRLIALKVF
jgi:hypothetical protein